VESGLPPLWPWLLLVFGVAVAATVPLVLLAERAGSAAGLVDHPRPGEVQRRPVPRSGGYAVFAAFWIAIGASFLLAPADLERLPADNIRLLGVFLGSLALLPLAIVDDRRRLGPWPQLLGQIVAATIPTFFGLRMDEIATPLGIFTVPDALAAPLAVLWIVAMMNAINLLDVMDGLAGGVAAIASGVLFLRTLWFGQASIAIVPLALGAACLGFLIRNWHPAHIILGSSGALFIGYMLGVVTVIGGVKVGTAFLLLAIPILDVAWVIYRRAVRGRSPVRGGDAEHLPHRLRMLGMSDRAVVLSLYMVCSLVGVAVLAMHSVMPTAEKAYLAGAVVIGVFVALIAVARLTAERESRPTRDREQPESAGSI
jgi:UDP-GlcNAc:undecaprenyl-phosphate/decaprenyl-phosphate GlcNAc-1-phosphate transferase